MEKRSTPLASHVLANTFQPAAEAVARQQQIAVAAYLRAEARGFAPGGELEDWLEAERKVTIDGRHEY
ncbi:MAG: DUF2934 domain-containing protein [Thiobacillus sp.]